MAKYIRVRSAHTPPPNTVLAMTDHIEKYGFTPVPRDPEVLFLDHPTASGPNPKQASYKLSEITFPDSELVQTCKAFVLKELNTPTFNHSNRVFIYGMRVFCLASSY